MKKKRLLFVLFRRGMLHLSLLVILLFLLSAVNTFAQGSLVKGLVQDEQGISIPGATVLLKGTTVGVLTDANGNYSISISGSGSDVLGFSFIGYTSQEIAVQGRTVIDVILVLETAVLEEVVVIGYGTAKKSDLTGSVQHIDILQFEKQANTDVIGLISGAVAGLRTTQGTNASGGGSMEIRGPNSLKASTSPLLVVDGVIYNGSLVDINPADILSIDVLKDASSSAIFGARSASGILIISTKRGKEGKPVINFTSKLGFTGVTNHMKPFGPEKYLKAKGDFRIRMSPTKPKYYYTNPNELPSDISIEEWKNYDVTPSNDPIGMWLNRLIVSPVEQQNYLAGNVRDWYNEIYQNGIRQDYDMSVSGGTSNVKYYFSNGYTSNKGFSIGDEYKIFRSRLNIDTDIAKFLKLGLNAQFADRDQSSTMIPLTDAIRLSPYSEKYNADGTLKMYPNDDSLVSNPYIYYVNRDRINRPQTLFATLTAQLSLPFGFSYQLAYTNRYFWGKNYYFDPLTTPNGLSNGGYGSRVNNSGYEFMIDNIIKWNKIFADIHKFDLTLLINAEKYQSWSDTQTNSKVSPSGALSYHGLQAGINPNLSNSDEYSTGNALMARLNYSLKNRYLLTVSWRRDGNSAFGLANPFSYFPSVALGWNVSDEPFFNLDWVNQFKIRGSWGVNGNSSIGRYDALSRLATTQYFSGNNLAVGVFTNTMANSELKWERTSALNIGFDFSLLGNRLMGNIDYYDMTTTDLLLDRSLPIIIGYTSVTSNLGELKNKGFELTLNSVNIDNQTISWKSGLTFSFNRNKIKHLYGEMIDVLDEEGNVVGQREADDIQNSWFIGQSIDRIWEYEVLGVYQLDDVDEAAKYGKAPGDIKLRDVNGDGKMVPNDDKTFQGYKTPRFNLGVRNDFVFLKNFEFSFFIRADINFYRLNNLYKNNATGGEFERTNSYDVPYWTPENPDNEWARPASNFSAPTFNIWKKSSFLRLQDLSLSYNFPRNILEKIKTENLRIFINARNYFTITPWEHWDPESGTTPMPKTITFGLNLSL